MAIKASPEAIREMKKNIQGTIRDIQKISSGIRSGMSATSSWNDSKAAEFNMVMQRVARLTEKPIETLSAALPKLEKLAQSLDEYNRTKFGS